MPTPPTGTITFLFTDIEGSTKLWENHPDAMKPALARHDHLLREAIEGRGGYVFKTVGDAFCAAFAEPTDALEAALAAQRMLQAEPWASEIGSIRIRAALHTGAAEERGGDYFGQPLNRVARLLSAGHGGQTLISLATQELLCDSLPTEASLLDMGEHRLKDLLRPERIYQINAPDLPSEFAPLKTLDLKLTNLPSQPTSFIGREKEISEVLELMRRKDVNLVTLTGPGGTGKTRLSLQVAGELIDEYEHGIFWVDLAPITDPDLVLTTIAAALGVKESGDQPLIDLVKYYLRERQLLLVIDNFEQVIKASPVVGELLKVAPKLNVITSSRERLHLYGEHDYPVPPLGLPDSKQQQTVAVVSQYEAVSLFIQRAKAVHSAFEITDQNAPAIAEICMSLDGLPLAIELAAARSRLLKPEAMLERLKNQLKMLTGGARDLPTRQQTIRDMIDWSYDLLNDSEKTLFRRLGVFMGGWTLEAAEAVCNHDLVMTVFEGLESLMDKSLIRQVEYDDRESRFGMLETIRQYSLEKLMASDEVGQIQAYHADYFVSLAESAADHLTATDQLRWFGQLEGDLDNFRLVMERSIQSGSGTNALKVGGTLWVFFSAHLHYHEMLERIIRALGLSGNQDKLTRANALTAIGHLQWFSGETNIEVRHMLEEGVQINRDLGNDRGLAASLRSLSMLIGTEGNYEEAQLLMEESLAIWRKLGDKSGVGWSLMGLGDHLFFQGEYTRATSCYEESICLLRDLNDSQALAYVLRRLGYANLHSNDIDSSETLFKESLNINNSVGDLRAVASCIGALGAISILRKDFVRATQLYGSAQALLESIPAVSLQVDHVENNQRIPSLRAQMDEKEFQSSWEAGRTMPWDKAIDFAMRDRNND